MSKDLLDTSEPGSGDVEREYADGGIADRDFANPFPVLILRRFLFE